MREASDHTPILARLASFRSGSSIPTRRLSLTSSRTPLAMPRDADALLVSAKMLLFVARLPLRQRTSNHH